MFGLKTRHVVIILALAAIVYVAAQFIMVYDQSFLFSDFVSQEVKFATSKRKSIEKIKASILEEAKTDMIPISQRDIRITKHGPTFTIEIDYSLPVNLRVYEYHWNMHVKESGPMFENDNN
jgi:hypothetical protein